MFIAMNRFKVVPGSQDDFETLWRERESHLHTVPGFVTFHMLRGPTHEDHQLYASHTVWASKEAFEGWTKSEAFRAAHSGARSTKPMYLDGPQFEGFEVIQTIDAPRAPDA